MLNGKTYYQILGVQPDAEDIVIRAAYRVLSQRYHPDKWLGDLNFAAERMTELNRAYASLSDSEDRKRYDGELRAASTNQYDPNDPIQESFEGSSPEEQANWQTAVQYFPDLNSYLKSLKRINAGLAFTFKSILLSKRTFDEARDLYLHLKSSYLQRYFGSNAYIISFAEYLIEHKKHEALLELNQVINALGESVPYQTVIRTIADKHKIKRLSNETQKKIEYVMKYDSPSTAASALKELGCKVVEHGKGSWGDNKYDVIGPEGEQILFMGDWLALVNLVRNKVLPEQSDF
jgi:curved DNA-binding protein CbpA